MFVPVTPSGELGKRVRKVVEEEGARIDVRVRVVESAGTSLNQQLVRTDLAADQPCRQQGCLLCNSGEGKRNTSHHRIDVLYRGTCQACDQKGQKAEYIGEAEYSAFTRTFELGQDIRRGNPKNAFVKHLTMFHPDENRDP